MRTTVDFDPDIAIELKRLRKKRDVALKELVNDLVRRGIRDLNTPARKKETFRTKSVDLGRPLIDVTNAAEALAIAEGEAFK
jgi:mRNA-degrading endonuclease RelE of RelBE toxin-antitoxin system